MVEWFKSLFRRQPIYRYGVYARGKLVAETVTKDEAEQYIRATYDEIAAQPQRTRSGFGGTYNTTRRQGWQAYRNQIVVRELRIK